MPKRYINFGVIGCGLMGREFASACARWCHLVDPKTKATGLDFAPRITVICDQAPVMFTWFTDNFPEIKTTTDYKELLANPDVEAIYCAVPHNLHAQLYTDIIRAGKHLIGEKPFGIDAEDNKKILEVIKENPKVLVRCSSEFPFYPGAQRVIKLATSGALGDIIDVEAGFHHSSDLDPNKQINWKRIVKTNGEYGCLGDLGMHVVHVPIRLGWKAQNVRALLSKVVTHRPDAQNKPVPCETWDNAILACEAKDASGHSFPMLLSTKRISPGDTDNWFIRVTGTKNSAEFTTKLPRTLHTLPYQPGQAVQAWHVEDLGYTPPYATITGGIFEFGFSDAILQMFAAFCDELVHGREGMLQPFYCATPEEAAQSHVLFTAALASQKTTQTSVL